MEGSAALAITSPKTHLRFHLFTPSSSPHRHTHIIAFQSKPFNCRISSPNARTSSRLLPPSALVEAAEAELKGASPTVEKDVSRRVDKSGRFCSPRAARELALLISYAACLEGADPVRLFDKRVNAKRNPGYVFDKESLLHYDHMSFGGAPVKTGTEEEAEELTRKNEEESANEAEVLTSPPKLVYNKFVLRMARDILVAVADRWNQNVVIINKIIPSSWKDEPAGRIIELCILHIAMAETNTLKTRHQIVINEAVDLAKRFCDGCAPRIINGCLRTFVKNHLSNEADGK